MNKDKINSLPIFFHPYINQVEEKDLMEALSHSVEELEELATTDDLEKIGNKTYAEGKWTVKDILQHIIDTERIMSYRALRFSRLDLTELPSFDEKLFAQNTVANQRQIDDLLEELIAVRLTTIQLFKNMTNIGMESNGTAAGQVVSASALGFVIVGHQKHHLNIIREKYLPLG